jgi:predicted enzyme related to lactoylglutathione lyase/uncharacterized protein YndB with AHSA1/START domain
MTAATAVTVTVEVGVDPATAFEVFTAEIDRWYVRGPYSWMDAEAAVGIRFEPGVGGRLLEVHDEATGDGFVFGRVTAWEPGRRLVFADLVSGATPGRPPDPPTEVEVRFEASPAGTTVTLEHRGLDRLPAAVAEQKREHGWSTVARWFASSFEPSAPAEVGYVTLNLPDTAKGMAFYGSLMGWAFEQGSSGPGYAHVTNTGLPLGLAPTDGPGGHTVYFRVGDLDAAVRRVEDLGGKADEPFTSPSGRGAACVDDQGVAFSLWQPAPGY